MASLFMSDFLQARMRTSAMFAKFGSTSWGCAMKYPVTRFKSLEIALKELEPFVRDGMHLQTGKPFKPLDGMRSRLALAN